MKTKFSGSETGLTSEARLDGADILIGGYYKHYKNKLYQVLDLAKHSEDLSPMVIYKSLYDNPLSKVWARPQDMFLEKLESGEPRFQLLRPDQWPVAFQYFHSHVYYTAESKQTATQLHQKISQKFELEVHAGSVLLTPLMDRCLGPHPLWMFEFNFKADFFSDAVSFLSEHRNGLSVLIHPLSGNAILDHTDYAMFLGQREKLNLAVLKA